MPQLPLLPGNQFDRNVGKSKFHKSHHFDYNNDVAMLVGQKRPGIGGVGDSSSTKYSVFPKGEGPTAPAWVAFDRQVLCFDAFFQEAVHEKREEQYRIRKCKIYFYLEDDSVQVIEPQVKNSGIPQGTLLRRHRVPLPPPNDSEYYTVDHFNVGNEITLYGRIFKLTSCDKFTLHFLSRLGVEVDKKTETPKDPYTNLREEIEHAMQPLRPYERLDKFKQFLEHDRHVLRFFGEWDDTNSMFGDVRRVQILYFLADDTIEIREIVGANSGTVPMNLRRSKLPKHAPIPLRQPGEVTDRTVLNVFGPMGHGGRYILDSLKTGAVTSQYYTDSDLEIGNKINVWGRTIEITNADEFTKEFYKSKYGTKTFNIKAPAPPHSPIPRQLPPYNGFGSEEDSLCSCMGLIPKPPQRDFIKFMEKDRSGLNSNVLRFVAFMKTQNPVDIGRKFIVSFFLSDDTISVFEPPQRNSGVVGGKFLERGRIRKPNQEIFKSEMSEYYLAKDLYVGAEVTFNDHIFTITDADEYAVGYMEHHSKDFDVANFPKILRKVSTCKDTIKNWASAQTDKLEYETFKEFLEANTDLVEHEIAVLGRKYAIRVPVPATIEYARAIAQEQLRKKNFEDFHRLLEACQFEDLDKTGKINVLTLRTICRAFKLPLGRNILNQLFKLSIGSDDSIEYSEFIEKLNWRDNQCKHFIEQEGNSLYGSDGAPVGLDIAFVDCQKILQDLR